MSTRVRIRGDEGGAVAVIVALMLVVLLGAAALVVDLGGSLSFRRQMVAAADSAALAAARACANGETMSSAQATADGFAAENAPGTTASNRTAFQAINGTNSLPLVCGVTSPSTGSVTVAYQRVRENVFAPILDQSTTTVGATATASWGPLGAGMPPPVLFAQSPFENCFSPEDRQTVPVSVPTEKKCVLWFEPATVESGQWGFLNLDTWNTPCNESNNGNPNILKYISPHDAVFKVDPNPSWVCLVPGHRSTNWTEDLHAQRYVPGVRTGLRHFPVTSGSRPSGGQTQVGVIGFAPVRILMVDAGNSAAGGGGGASTCDSAKSRATGATFSLDSLSGSGCPGTIDRVTDGPQLFYETGPDRDQEEVPATECVGSNDPEDCHYSYNPVTRTVTWLDEETRVRVVFTWVSPRTPGSCEAFAPDAENNPRPPGNSSAVACLVVSWPGPQTASGYIGDTSDFGVRAVDLTG